MKIVIFIAAGLLTIYLVILLVPKQKMNEAPPTIEPATIITSMSSESVISDDVIHASLYAMDVQKLELADGVIPRATFEIFYNKALESIVRPVLENNKNIIEAEMRNTLKTWIKNDVEQAFAPEEKSIPLTNQINALLRSKEIEMPILFFTIAPEIGTGD
jgi:hypothetical protein